MVRGLSQDRAAGLARRDGERLRFGALGSQESVSVRIADTRPAGKHHDGFAGRQERGFS